MLSQQTTITQNLWKPQRNHRDQRKRHRNTPQKRTVFRLNLLRTLRQRPKTQRQRSQHHTRQRRHCQRRRIQRKLRHRVRRLIDNHQIRRDRRRPHRHRTHIQRPQAQTNSHRLHEVHHATNRNLIHRRQTGRRTRRHQQTTLTSTQQRGTIRASTTHTFQKTRAPTRSQRTQLTRRDLLTHRGTRTHRNNLNHRMRNLLPQRRGTVLLGSTGNLRIHADYTPTARLQVVPHQRHKRAQCRQNQGAACRVSAVSDHRVMSLGLTESQLLHKVQNIVQGNCTQTAEHARDQCGKGQPHQEAKRKRVGTRRNMRAI